MLHNKVTPKQTQDPTTSSSDHKVTVTSSSESKSTGEFRASSYSSGTVKFKTGLNLAAHSWSTFTPEKLRKRKSEDSTTSSSDSSLIEFKEECFDNKITTPKTRNWRDLYRKDFLPQPHVNFICEKDSTGVAVFSALLNPCNRFNAKNNIFDFGEVYRGLLTDAAGQHEIAIPSLVLKKSFESLADSFQNFLETQVEPGYSLYKVTADDFPYQLSKVEETFPLKKTTLKIGVTYTKKSERVKKLYKIDKPAKSSKFWAFIDSMGTRINTKGWTKYLGDMLSEGVDTYNDTYFISWNKVEIMYHVAPMLTSEQHRRLIGNDIVQIIYYDNSTEPFNPDFLTCFGNVPQVFSVVSPLPDSPKFSLTFYSRASIPSYEPLNLPAHHALNLDELKEFILVRSYNGHHISFTAPPLDKFHTRPRELIIADLARQFPRPRRRRAAERSDIDESEAAAKRKERVDLEDFLVDPGDREGLLIPTLNWQSSPKIDEKLDFDF